MSDKGNLPSDPAYQARHRNPTSMKDDYDKIVNDSMEKSQLEHSDNAIDVREKSIDPLFPDYAVEKGVIPNIAPIEKAGNPDSIRMAENERFCIEHDISQEDMKQNKGMKLNQQTDSPADETPTE